MLPTLTSNLEERKGITVISRIFASIGDSLLIRRFGLQIVDFLGKENAPDGFTHFAWLIAIIFIITVGITVLNVK